MSAMAHMGRNIHCTSAVFQHVPPAGTMASDVIMDSSAPSGASGASGTSGTNGAGDTADAVENNKCAVEDNNKVEVRSWSQKPTKYRRMALHRWPQSLTMSQMAASDGDR